MNGFKRVCASMLVLLNCVACTPIGDGPSISSSLRIGVSDEPDSLNPLFSHTAIADDLAALTLAPLFRYDDRGGMVPELALRVPTLSNGDVSADGRSITLHLRRHLRWSDGAALDAQDVIFTWRAVMNPANNTKLRAGWDNVAVMSAPNPYTVVVKLRKPDATVLSLFAGGGDAAYPPLPAHLLKRESSLNHVAFNAHPLSSGPWIVSDWQHGSSLTLKPNKNYWRGLPGMKEMKFLLFPQADTLMTALQTHEIDYVDTVPEDRLLLLPQMSGIVATSHVIAAYRHLDFNVHDPLLRDVRVRLAIIEGVQWNRILHTVYHDAGVPAVSDIFPTSFAAPQLPLYSYNPADAARLLDESGWKLDERRLRSRNGVPLSLTIMSSNAKATSAQAELQIAADAQRLGVQIQPKNLPTSYLFAQNGPLYSGTYQLAWAADTRGPDPDNSANWTTSAQPPNGGNTVFLSDPVVDGTAQAALRTFDVRRRRALYQREEERLHQLAPSYIFMWQRATIAMTQHLHGVRPAPFYSNFWNSWQWRLR